ncbi:hypothetical protein MBH78_14255 [Oceanimonas sp. NS1]|nr:hypothetical protein [Oceanimonas sp. NS1]
MVVHPVGETAIGNTLDRNGQIFVAVAAADGVAAAQLFTFMLVAQGQVLTRLEAKTLMVVAIELKGDGDGIAGLFLYGFNPQ